MCGKLLVAILPNLLGSLERHGELQLASREDEALLSMSAATIDRRLWGWRRGVARQPRRHAGATTDLKAQIPIRSWSEWRDASPSSVLQRSIERALRGLWRRTDRSERAKAG